jgi:FKBP-type peptidyl-prolyl cis-trans isomerase
MMHLINLNHIKLNHLKLKDHACIIILLALSINLQTAQAYDFNILKKKTSDVPNATKQIKDKKAGAMRKIKTFLKTLPPQELKKTNTKMKRDSEMYMRRNAKKKGVFTVMPGMQVQIIKQGYGPTPKADQTVSMRYEIQSIYGRVLQSTLLNLFPSKVNLKDISPAWRAGIMMMPAHSIWIFTFSSRLLAMSTEKKQELEGIPSDTAFIIKTMLVDVH